MKRGNKITAALFFLYLAVLTWIILLKMQFSFSDLDHFRRINWIPFAGSVVTNGTIDLDEIINNLIVFIPVGGYLGMLKPGWPFWKKVCPIFGLSLVYEILQFVFAIGASDITDLLSNTLGGVVGIVFVWLISKGLKEKTNAVLTVVAAACTVLVLAFLALLLVANR
ncbi:MAG: VanZ family protein [Eubacteriales bacterium]|nr:VanZ family protein [Eubacteriales bacterium]